MRYIKLFSFIFLVYSSNVVYAADTSLKYGVLFGGSNIDVDDPEGETQAKSTVDVFNLAIVSPLIGNKRLYVHGYNYFAGLEADQTNLGQEVTIIGVTGSLQFNIFDIVWIGGGVGVTQESYKSRYTTDATGKFTERSEETEPELGDETFVTFPIVLSISKEWTANKALSFGTHITYSQPIGGRTKYITGLVGVYF